MAVACASFASLQGHALLRVEGRVVLQAEPTFRAQLWRTVRTLFVAFVVLSGVGALMEERGLTKGILNNPDMRPQIEMKTRFADVKGVDEAKVACPFCTCPPLHVLRTTPAYRDAHGQVFIRYHGEDPHNLF